MKIKTINLNSLFCSSVNMSVCLKLRFRVCECSISFFLSRFVKESQSSWLFYCICFRICTDQSIDRSTCHICIYIWAYGSTKVHCIPYCSQITHTVYGESQLQSGPWGQNRLQRVTATYICPQERGIIPSHRSTLYHLTLLHIHTRTMYYTLPQKHISSPHSATHTYRNNILHRNNVLNLVLYLTIEAQTGTSFFCLTIDLAQRPNP